MTDLRALALFARTLLLVFVLTGLGPAIAIAILWERFRVIEIGFEKSSPARKARCV